MSATTGSSSPALDTFRDIILWRRKKLSATVILVSTATWVLLEVYQFNFITVASWVALFIVASLFLWGNVLRLLGKEPPNLSNLEISEHSGVEIADNCPTLVQEAIRWMFHVTVNWFAFARTVTGLLLLSYVGSFIDLLTFLYIGIVMVMTVAVIYAQHGDQINRCGERMKIELRRVYEMFDKKMLKNKTVKQEQETEKEKKAKEETEKEKKVE